MLAVSIVGAIIVNVTIFTVVNYFFDFNFITKYNCGETLSIHYCLFNSEFNKDSYLSIISNFYNTVITVLLALSAILATLAFVVIKESAKQHTLDAVSIELEKYFAGDKSQKDIASKIESLVAEKITEIDKTNQKQFEAIRIALEDEGIVVEEVARMQNAQDS